MGDLWWQQARLKHQTAPPGTKPVSSSSRARSAWTSIVSGNGISGGVKSCRFAVWSMMDSDVAGLPMVLSRDAAASSGREPAASDARNEGDSGDEIGARRGRYPPDLEDVANTGNTSTVSRSKSNHTLLGDSCTNDKCDTGDP